VCILSDCEFSSHSFKERPERKYRVLYAGNNLRLLKFLGERLKDCFVVRAPGGAAARALIAGETRYALFLFDEELPDMTAAELERFTQERREGSLVAIIQRSDTFSSIVKAVARSLRDS